MTGPNPRQRELIERTDGCYLVDAGPGTGKTFTITRRYARIVEQAGVEPDDVLLLTFTRNAATEMRDRITAHSAYSAREFQDAPIGTFHSLCNDVLREHGFDAPSHLGLEESITRSTRVLEDETLERESFREFIGRFTDDHPEHHDVLRALSDPTEVLGLIETLAAKGVFPTVDGWYRDCEAALYGDAEAFDALFEAVNRPQNDGSRQSVLRSRLNRYGNGCYLPDAPSKAEIRGEQGSKSVPHDVSRLVFEEEREDLFAFVHDVYIEYLEFALSRNYLTFSFLQLFAFVHLCENESLRERLSFEYVMIDEFQDTSEIQFKLALLLAGTENVCVVGDWKQSIYSFQYADVENITRFREHLTRFVDDLNADRTRIEASFDTVEAIELERNYRSTQAIVDCAERALVVPGSRHETVDADAVLERVVSLSSETDLTHSQIEAIRHADEHEAILTKIDEIVGNEAYAVRTDGTGGGDSGSECDGSEALRPPEYGDIVVLTRTRDFGRELLAAGEKHGFPMAYEGGVELFRTDPAKLVLAWLRILERGPDEDRGWAAVLEHAGYTLEEMRHVLSAREYPAAMVAFRDELEALETVSTVAHRVCHRYGCDGPTADVLRTTIQSVHDTTTKTRGDLIRFIERGIEAGTTHEVSAAGGTNAVRVQTIHAAKGLEYPIVILANMNAGSFPTTGRRSGRLRYDERFGLRQRTLYGEAHGQPHVYDNWRWDVLSYCRPTAYDEERRLLYVAMTRAADHLVFSAGEEPNTFLEGLPVDLAAYEPDVSQPDRSETIQTRFDVSIPEPAGPEGYSPHSLMNDEVFEAVEEGRGPDYGSRVHAFAERYALGEDVDPRDADERHVKAFVDTLEGERRVEEDAYLPLSVDGKRVTIHGVVDLVHVTEETVEIVDYKTDLGRHAENEYRAQVSVYWHVLHEVYPDREVVAKLFYTADGTSEDVSPLSKAQLESLVEHYGR
ncbi:UvrD-helicase domain-containing protein [Natronobiforma cellulositropha]|uniref:UvrD-helicase domain-containing protein n=1 Tax=Natronobiforma cellulositropha TaxID=1679076 RepID=UPI0021D5F491|nr:UvrD-helicase domain-containing protein [Natronobiforma cellulositropha]